MSDVDDMINRQGPENRKLGTALRKIIRDTLSDATEDTNAFGDPLYAIGGRNVVWIAFARDHVDLGFFDGVSLKSGILTGTGRKLRHVRMKSTAEIDRAELTKLLGEAAKMAREGQ